MPFLVPNMYRTMRLSMPSPCYATLQSKLASRPNPVSCPAAHENNLVVLTSGTAGVAPRDLALRSPSRSRMRMARRTRTLRPPSAPVPRAPSSSLEGRPGRGTVERRLAPPQDHRVLHDRSPRESLVARWPRLGVAVFLAPACLHCRRPVVQPIGWSRLTVSVRKAPQHLLYSHLQEFRVGHVHQGWGGVASLQ